MLFFRATKVIAAPTTADTCCYSVLLQDRGLVSRVKVQSEEGCCLRRRLTNDNSPHVCAIRFLWDKSAKKVNRKREREREREREPKKKTQIRGKRGKQKERARQRERERERKKKAPDPMVLLALLLHWLA